MTLQVKQKAAMITTMMALVMSAVFCLGLWGPGDSQAKPPSTPAAAAPDQTPAAPPAGNDSAKKLSVTADYGRLPLYFIANQGQVDKRVQYYVKGGGQTTFFTQDEVVLVPGPAPTQIPPYQTRSSRLILPLTENRKPKTENSPSSASNPWA